MVLNYYNLSAIVPLLYPVSRSDHPNQLTPQQFPHPLPGSGPPADLATRAALLCGPDPFMAALRRSLLALGVPEAHIGTESFA